MAARSRVAWVVCLWASMCAAVAAEDASSTQVAHACADDFEDLSATCAAELDRLFLDQRVGALPLPGPFDFPGRAHERQAWWPGPLVDSMRWRDVLADPLALRRAVAKAADAPKCRAMPGEAPHSLREDCAAHEFARLSALHYACGEILYWEEVDWYDWDAQWAESRQHLDGSEHYRAQYAAQVARLEAGQLHFVWRLAKCRDVPNAAMAPIEAVRPPYLGNVSNTHDQGARLLIIAARLGNVWANLHLAESEGAMNTPRERNATAEVNLALAFIQQARFADARFKLPFLLAAKVLDTRDRKCQIDWRELADEFSREEIAAAKPIARRLVQEGWRPLPESEDSDLTWPWAIAPPVVETRFIARRYDRYGNVRWVYPYGSEYWIGHDGLVQQEHQNSDLVVTGHSQISTAGVVLRRWRDADGNERWADGRGHEHWVDEDGAEHWIDWGGTEWILLPIGDPLPTTTQ